MTTNQTPSASRSTTSPPLVRSPEKPPDIGGPPVAIQQQNAWRAQARWLSVLMICSLTLLTLPLVSGCQGQSGSGDQAAQGGGERRGRRGQKDKNSGPQEFLTPVITERVTRGKLQVTVSATASVVPVRSETIQSLESGILVFTRAWEEGDRVTSGTLLITLDNEDLRKQVQTAERDLELQRQTQDIQRIRLRQAEREYVIIQDLYARGLAPLRDVESSKLSLENSRNNVNQTAVNLEKAELSLDNLQERLAFLEIRAPLTGTLVSRSTIEGRSGLSKTFGSEPLRSLEGRYIGRSTALFGIIDISNVILKCEVTSKDVSKISPGQPAFGVVYGRENLEVEGKVAWISSNVSPDTRAFEVQVVVPNPEERLRPGMFGRMEIVVQELEDVVAVPKNVVQRRGEQDIVFVVDRDSTLPHPVASQVPVDLGVESKDQVEVTYGLKSGDELVIRGYEILQDRIPIQVSAADEPTT